MFTADVRVHGRIVTKAAGANNGFYPKVAIIDVNNSGFDIIYTAAELATYADGTVICEPLMDNLGIMYKTMYVEYQNRTLLFNIDKFLRGDILWGNTTLAFSDPYTFNGGFA